MYNVENNKVDLNGDGIPENFNVGRFIFTKKTITYGGKTLQLSNVAKIQKFSFRETWKPIFKISNDLKNKSIGGLIASILILYFGASIQIISTLSIMGICISAGILLYSYNERNRKKPFDKDYFGLIIESNSGKSENLLTNSNKFISQLFNEITKAMNDEGASMIVANFNNHEIKYENNSKVEKMVLGDNFEDISSSTILNRTNVSDQKLELDQLLRDIEDDT